MQAKPNVSQVCWRLKKRLFCIALVIVGATLLTCYNMLPHSFQDETIRRKFLVLDTTTPPTEKTTIMEVPKVKPVNNEKRTYIKPVDPVSLNSNSLIDLIQRNSWRDINRHIHSVLHETIKHEKGTGCVPPKLNPFAPEMMRLLSDTVPKIDCKMRDWVKCYQNNCTVTAQTLSLYNDIKCNYSKLIYHHDFKVAASKEITVVHGNNSYSLNDTDEVFVSCNGMHKRAKLLLSYEAAQMGIRSELSQRPETKSKYNILMVGFDSVSHSYVQRRMVHLYKALKDEFGAVILETYNIVGDGTTAALTPLFTGMAEHELPEVRKSKEKFGNKHTVDEYPLIFKMLRDIGFRTAYFEDMPEVGTWQLRMVGFKHRPADHYLRPVTITGKKSKLYCHFGTPMHEVMFNLTEQVMTIDKKRKFVFTFSGGLSHDDYNMVKHADKKTVNLLRRFRDDGLLNDTFVIVMGDHGSRYGKMRDTIQGKQEERMPLMSFIVPQSFKVERPQAYENLKNNVKTLTTPFDIHSTLLDVLDLNEHRIQTKVPGSDLPRSMSLFDPIPSSRSCSEAFVEPQWCACLEWIKLPPDDPLFERVAHFFVDHINILTEKFRDKCIKRTLKSVDYVSRRKPNDKLLTFVRKADRDGFVGQYGNASKYTANYQVKLTVGPGEGIFEATLTYYSETDKLSVANRDISRINAYHNEPRCVSGFRPDLNMFCYCTISED